MSNEIAPTTLKPPVVRRQPQLVKINGRYVVKPPCFNPPALLQYVRTARPEKSGFHSLTALGGVCYHRRSQTGTDRVRRSLHRLFKHALDEGVFIVYQTDGPHGKISALKILDPDSESDRQTGELWLQRKLARGEIAQDIYDKASNIIHDVDPVAGLI